MKIGFVEILTSENLRAIRPELGLVSKYLDFVPGSKVRVPIKQGTLLS